MAMLICNCKCRHLNTRLKFSTGFATVDNEHQRTFHSNKTEFVFCILPADVYLCKERFWNGDCVTDDDTFARTEVVESHHETISFGVAHDEGEGNRILGAWVYIFLKNPYLSKACFMHCFWNSKTSWKF